jgi:hypothetical protein
VEMESAYLPHFDAKQELKYSLRLSKKKKTKKQRAVSTSSIRWSLRHWYRINVHSYLNHPISVL